MSPDEYLARMRQALKGVPAKEQEIFLEEIAGHLADLRVNGGENGLVEEMGAPEDLARRLKQVHRPDRWIDYLLMAVPEGLLFSGAITLFSILIFPDRTVGPNAPGIDAGWGFRMAIFFYGLMIMISLLRRQQTGRLDLLLYWLPATWLTIFSLCFREQRWLVSGAANATEAGLAESIFWLATLLGIGFYLVRLLWGGHDPQLVVLALLPFLVTTGNVASSRMIVLGGFPDGYNLPNWQIGPWFGVSQIAMFVWPALFYLFAQRPVRWLGLLVRATPITLMNLVASTRYPAIAALWSLPVLLVLAGWLIDRPADRRPSGLPQ